MNGVSQKVEVTQMKRVTEATGMDEATLQRCEAIATTQKESYENAVQKSDFGISVDWPVGDEAWKSTTHAVKATAAITRYRLYETTGLWSYRLEFTSTKTYDYAFFDATGDSYSVSTYLNGDHYVRYNSNKPTILYISSTNN